MSKPLRSSIGLILLVTTVSLSSCQSMLKVISADKGIVTIGNQK